MAAKPDEGAIKARVIKHLNNDHQDSLVLYLEHYLKLSSFSARNAQLADLNLTSLTVSASGASHVVAYPAGPIKSYSELRPVVVAMDQECRRALGRSEITMKTFVPPSGFGAVFALWAFYNLVTMTDRANYAPGSWMYEHIHGYVPWYAQLCYANARLVWWIIVGAHGIELVTIFLPKLRKHNVPVGSGLWFTWAASQFFLDGIGTIWRFDGHVQAKLKEKEKASH